MIFHIFICKMLLSCRVSERPDPWWNSMHLVLSHQNHPERLTANQGRNYRGIQIQLLCRKQKSNKDHVLQKLDVL